MIAKAQNQIEGPPDFSLLLKAEYRILLARCYLQPQTVTALARHSGAKPNTVYRRVQRLVQAGVLMVAYEQKRAGKIVKAYAPAQDTFDIPFHMTPFSSFAEYMTGRLSETLRMNLEKAYERLDLQEPQISLRVFCRQGVMQLDPVWGTWTTAETHHHLFAAATTLSRWVPLQLTQAELQALQADLEALTARYYRPFEEGDRQTAALGLFLLPN